MIVTNPPYGKRIGETGELKQLYLDLGKKLKRKFPDYVVGKISQLDVLRALEPKYQDMVEGKESHRLGISKSFMRSVLKDYNLFANPLDDICRKAGEQPVKNFMHTPTEGEYVSENATLDLAIHQLIMGQHQSLLVTRDEKIVGILRLTDVFAAVFHKMKECFL